MFKDKRRKHIHWMVTVFYMDGGKFIRVYTNRKKADGFAHRQRVCPLVRLARVTEEMPKRRLGIKRS